MNTTGMTEMGDPNNVPVKKGLFQRMRNTFTPYNSSHWNANRAKNQSRRKQSLNNVKAYGKTKGSTYRTFSKPYDLYGNLETTTNLYNVPERSVVGKIGIALLSLYYVARAKQYGKSPLERQATYNKTVQTDLKTFARDKETAQEAIFEYLNKYMPFKGRSYLENVQRLLEATHKAFSKARGSYANQTVVWMLEQPEGLYSFWGNILPADEEQLKQMASQHTSLVRLGIQEEQNPMVVAPNASTLPMPNFSEPMMSEGGRRRRHRTRRRTTRKH